MLPPFSSDSVRLLSIGAGRYPNATTSDDFKLGGAGFVVHGRIDDLFRASVEGTDEVSHLICRSQLKDKQYRRIDPLIKLRSISQDEELLLDPAALAALRKEIAELDAEDFAKLTLDATDLGALARLERAGKRAIHEDDLLVWVNKFSNFLRRSFIKSCTFTGDEMPVEQTM